MMPADGGTAKKEHRLTMDFGEVKIFVRKV
jgi:hypothetical protein